MLLNRNSHFIQPGRCRGKCQQHLLFSLEADSAQEAPAVFHLSGETDPESFHRPLALKHRPKAGRRRNPAAAGRTGRMRGRERKPGNGVRAQRASCRTEPLSAWTARARACHLFVPVLLCAHQGGNCPKNRVVCQSSKVHSAKNQKKISGSASKGGT